MREMAGVSASHRAADPGLGASLPEDREITTAMTAELPYGHNSPILVAIRKSRR